MVRIKVRRAEKRPGVTVEEMECPTALVAERGLDGICIPLRPQRTGPKGQFPVAGRVTWGPGREGLSRVAQNAPPKHGIFVPWKTALNSRLCSVISARRPCPPACPHLHGSSEDPSACPVLPSLPCQQMGQPRGRRGCFPTPTAAASGVRISLPFYPSKPLLCTTLRQSRSSLGLRFPNLLPCFPRRQENSRTGRWPSAVWVGLAPQSKAKALLEEPVGSEAAPAMAQLLLQTRLP